MKKRKTFRKILAALLVIFIALQFVRPSIPQQPVTSDIQAPPEVKAILKRACYDCHSNETELRWFDQISPASWRVADHIKSGRAVLNFSEWDKLAASDRAGKLWESVNQVAAGAMPLKDYETIHRDAHITEKDLTILKDYLAATVKDQPNDTAKQNAAKQQYQNWIDGKMKSEHLPTTLNGITYMPDYKNWQAISTTDRFDNGTMRVIFGNDVAVKAIHDGKINPWPDGTIFAKVAWDQLEDKDGNVATGAFKQIEYMIKDSRKYADTHGWGFARFKTPQLIPYGKTATFTSECVGCHKPVADRDFVFTSPLKN